jgi:hypothetical protein
MPDQPAVPITPPSAPVVPTQSITDIQKQVDDLKQLLQGGDEGQGVEIGEAPMGPGGQPTRGDGVSKWMINISFIVFGLAGVVGSVWNGFDMTKYTQFLQTFAYVWAPLVVAVGGGRAFKNWTEKKYVPPAPPSTPVAPKAPAPQGK